MLTGNHADRHILLRFGIPAIIGSFAGAQLLLTLASGDPLYAYSLQGKTYYITPVKIIAFLLAAFSLFEVIPRFRNLSFGPRYLPAGGLLSGFFGGLSGLQGALRSAFLIKTGLSRESFIATGVVIALMVDVSRLAIYFRNYESSGLPENLGLVLVATLCALAGALIGNSLLKKVTFESMKILVTIMLFVISILIGAGIL